MRHELAQMGGGAHALAVQILGNADDAADAVHDAFETALAKPERYDSRNGPLRPWFLRVVRNRCIDKLRRRRGSDMPVEQLLDAGAAPDQAFAKAETAALVQAALRSISSDQRQGEDIWRENMNDSTIRTTRGIGWLLLVGGLLVLLGWAVFTFIVDSSVPLGVKLLTIAIYGGLGVLFVSVLWQRLVERKSDKYKDVEI